MAKEKERIFVGDLIKYKPTKTVFRVKEIYADSCYGEFNLASGKFQEARAILVLEGDSGQYPVDKDIEKM